MVQQPLERIVSKSEINYNYTTVKMTQSRIEKGLIAMPRALAEWFPLHNADIQVYLDDSPVLESKNYSSYDSSTRECRIGGMREWFRKNNIRTGDEVVIQMVDKHSSIYRIASEEKFVDKTRDLQRTFDDSQSEEVAEQKIGALVHWTLLDKNGVVLNEFKRQAHTVPIQARSYIQTRFSRARESAPASVRTLLGALYRGYCQVCDFGFLKRDSKPFFEIHHLNPSRGHHPKNLVVVCGNCHNQFEHANVHIEFDNNDWLVRVSFNNRPYQVRQVLSTLKLEDPIKEVFIL